MGALSNKIRAWKKNFASKTHNFGISLACYSFLFDFNSSVTHMDRLQSYFLNKKSKFVFEYVEKYNKAALIGIDIKKEEKLVEMYPVWTFWFQGFDKAPYIVQKCSEQMERAFCNKKYKVYKLDLSNIDKYIDIPKYIKEKVESGNIGLALYSDFIRISLIEKYGGIWIDSTCYCLEPIQDLTTYPFFSCKTNNLNPLLTSKEQWANYCLGSSKKHELLFQYLRGFLLEYWKNENSDVDYLLTDYSIRLAYNNLSVVKERIDSLEENNVNRGKLMPMLNDVYDENKLNEITSNTWLFKLTYKQQLKQYDANNNETFYGKLFK